MDATLRFVEGDAPLVCIDERLAGMMEGFSRECVPKRARHQGAQA